MNKKILALLLVLIAVMSVATVSADSFDGRFEMNCSNTDVPKDILNSTGDTYLSQFAWIVNENVSVFYYTHTLDEVLSTLKTNTGFMDEPTEDGNLTVLENPDAKSGVSFKYFVGVSSDNETVFLGSDNLDLAKEYAKTVGFYEV